jgi:hypothetical protein
MNLFMKIFAGAFALILVSVAIDIIVACVTMRHQRTAIEDYIAACREVERLA